MDAIARVEGPGMRATDVGAIAGKTRSRAAIAARARSRSRVHLADKPRKRSERARGG
jgi:hypothetical protein